ncbi:hypothetical protein QBC33DRAFT_603803 [Phialemonium atrogriseum]|uniref:Uncharacterized protein n=1 Tax=Phialemonium atrogriseum TaxID=1093897 RepID=A0AAJ0BNY6_9PEZI|nr:uncharacterized protein QBC33DRAFT_603803 [Phialemonium atrogriseum]KAK1761795.1 hypothetical protein QBC33DRAFT_603803 [Phialemonium atrogriseum]
MRNNLYLLVLDEPSNFLDRDSLGRLAVMICGLTQLLQPVRGTSWETGSVLDGVEDGMGLAAAVALYKGLLEDLAALGAVIDGGADTRLGLVRPLGRHFCHGPRKSSRCYLEVALADGSGTPSIITPHTKSNIASICRNESVGPAVLDLEFTSVTSRDFFVNLRQLSAKVDIDTTLPLVRAAQNERLGTAQSSIPDDVIRAMLKTDKFSNVTIRAGKRKKGGRRSREPREPSHDDDDGDDNDDSILLKHGALPSDHHRSLKGKGTAPHVHATTSSVSEDATGGPRPTSSQHNDDNSEEDIEVGDGDGDGDGHDGDDGDIGFDVLPRDSSGAFDTSQQLLPPTKPHRELLRAWLHFDPASNPQSDTRLSPERWLDDCLIDASLRLLNLVSSTKLACLSPLLCCPDAQDTPLLSFAAITIESGTATLILLPLHLADANHWVLAAALPSKKASPSTTPSPAPAPASGPSQPTSTPPSPSSWAADSLSPRWHPGPSAPWPVRISRPQTTAASTSSPSPPTSSPAAASRSISTPRSSAPSLHACYVLILGAAASSPAVALSHPSTQPLSPARQMQIPRGPSIRSHRPRRPPPSPP